MPRPRPALPSSITGPVTCVEARASGLTRSQFASAGLVQPHHGIWVPKGFTDTLEGRAAAALHGLPARAAISHRTAAVLRGLPVPELPGVARNDEPLHITVPAPKDIRRRGVHIHQLVQPFRIEQVHRGVRVTSAARTWLDLAPDLNRDDLVVLGDAITNRGLGTVPQLAALLAANPGHRGVRIAARVLPLLNPKADSPPETRVRLLLWDNGLTGFVVNEAVFDEFGEWIGQPDIAFRPPRLALQYEGDHHRTDPDQWASDIGRDDVMRENGWIILRLVAVDLRRPQSTVYRIRRELELRGYRP